VLAALRQRFLSACEFAPKRVKAAYFACGALLMLGFAPSGHFWLAPFAMMPLLYSCLVNAPRAAAWHGFFFGCGLFLAGTYWFYVSIHVFGGAPLWVAIFLMLSVVTIMGLYNALAAWLISKLARGRIASLVVVAPSAWVVVEWLRGWFLSGFPWMTLGYGQIDSPLAGFATVLGVYGVSLAVLLCAASLLAALLSASQSRYVFLSIALLPWIAGHVLLKVDWTRPVGDALRTTIVQGGVSQDRKWLPEQFNKTLALYRDATLSGKDHSLIVWPEVALPATIDQVETYLGEIEERLLANDQSLLLGILERNFSNAEIYNSVLMLNGKERRTYRKRHLVPFGEYFPVPDFIREWMRLMSLPNSDMTPGDATQALLETTGGEKIAVAICYEDAYGAEQLYAFPVATLIVNVSNDAWFGDTIAPHQHLEIARMRALEVGRFVIRATNNGVSAYIDEKGRILQTGPQFEFVSMTRDVQPLAGMTPYARTGNGLLIALLCSVLMVTRVHRKRPAQL
jgi:apolipoprotein N-acyltransferase